LINSLFNCFLACPALVLVKKYTKLGSIRVSCGLNYARMPAQIDYFLFFWGLFMTGFLQGLLHGVLHLPWWGYIVVTLVLTHITIVAVTLYLHRSQAHRACDFHPVVSHFFRLWLWLTTGMMTKQFVTIHRKHHAKCETEDDPHSPQIEGIRKVLWQGVELYRMAALDREDLERYAHGCPDDWVERHVYSKYSAKGVLLMLLLDIIFLGTPGITVWAVQMMWIPFLATGVINGLSHYWGYRNFEVPDASTNVSPWGILIGGEELHNNHHTFGTSAKFSVKWWEIDIGWLYLRLLQAVGLATINRVAPTPQITPSKSVIDAETIKAVFTNRFQVVAQYTKRVLLPIYNEERRKADLQGTSKLFYRAKRLFVKEHSLVDASGREQMAKVFAGSENLERVYHLRLSLQALWEKTTLTQKELIQALQDWCAQAEASGLDVLTDFVRHLKMYTVAASK
jgi:stearoyl-CoA desaturase (delta-9 desaturase)